MTRTPAVPRRPRMFVGVAGRAARALTTTFSALVFAAGALAVTPAPAHADEITSQGTSPTTTLTKHAPRVTPARV